MTPDIERIRVRIEALLRLADGNANVHEAEAAAAAAQALMDRYRVQRAEAEPEAEPELVQRVVPTGVSTRTVWRGALALAIARANHCAAWWRGPHLVFCGTDDDTAHCEVLYRFVDKQVERLAAKAAYGKGPRYRTEFIQGLVVGIRDRLAATPRDTRFDRLDKRVRAEAQRLELEPTTGQGPRDVVAFATGRAHGGAVALEQRPALPSRLHTTEGGEVE